MDTALQHFPRFELRNVSLVERMRQLFERSSLLRRLYKTLQQF
ncbi:MAG: hypothetical protein RMK72_00480 [Chloroflexus sp.]|nr:hypothetical protein [Chloroflexus sp.]MDW8402624.1 hypothetical protein [Chloroflexus sp.]